MSKCTRRSGFTLIELLTVIAIVSIAVAIAIPAIQRARESARQIQCKNNLKQIGLALHNYHEAFGRLPSGFIGVNSQGQPEVSGPTGWGWAAMILPQLDEDALFNNINFGSSILDNENSEVIHNQLSSFRCPSDPGAGEFTLLAADGQTPLAQLPTANYVGNFGSGDIDYCNNLIGMGIPCTSGPSLKSDGVFFHNSSTKLASIVDGTSHTMMVAERSSSHEGSAQRTPTWLGVVPGSQDAFSLNLGSMSVYPSQALKHDDGFSSAHAGVVDMLMADGHVQKVANDTDPQVLLSMASRGSSGGGYSMSANTSGWGNSGGRSNGDGGSNGDGSNGNGNNSDGGNAGSNPSSNTPSSAGSPESSSSPALQINPQIALPGGSSPRFPFRKLMVSRPSTAKKMRSSTGALTAEQVNLPGFPEWDGHFFVTLPDGSHGTWGGVNPDTVGPIIIRYDYRSLFGFPNRINEAEIGVVEASAKLWSEATCNRVIFVRDQVASDDEIIILGKGNLLALDIPPDGPFGVLGVGGFTSFVGNSLVGGFTWMDEEENWDAVIGNGNPAQTIDFFTVLVHEFGHALGLRHNPDLVPGDNFMNPFYDGEETQLNVNDISTLEVLYGTNCLSGPGRGGVRNGWERSDTTGPPPAGLP